MKICNNKKYRTRNGQAVVIDRKRANHLFYPVTGRFADGSRDLRWARDGRFLYEAKETGLDLIEYT